MNKSILKHEIREMKWVMILSLLTSLFLVTMFNVFLVERYEGIFIHGINGNDSPIQWAFREVSSIILIGFSLVAIVQIFMQFKSEKSQETSRFLKSLPVKRGEFFKIKLGIGIINLSLAFVVLALGLIVVRSNNMFWIEDIHKISLIANTFRNLDGVGSLLKELSLIYLVILSFYTFLFMIQYTFTNIVGGIVTGVLVWLAPFFILVSSIFTLSGISSISLYSSNILNKIDAFSKFLLPHLYPFDFKYNELYQGEIGSVISTVDNLLLKYIVLAVLILINIFIAYKFNENLKVEDENKVIPFKISRGIFKFGVTICSGLLVSIILSDIIMIPMSSIINILFILLGGVIGFLVSRKITKVESI